MFASFDCQNTNNLVSPRILDFVSGLQLFFKMMNLKTLISVLAFAAALDAVAIPPHHEVHEERESLPSRWTKRDRVGSHKLLPMRIGLTQTNLETGYDSLMDV
jgi:tripeptidyl-peptidase-1